MKLAISVCPRCGRPISSIIVREIYGRRYIYAVHYVEEGGKKKKKQCYLGPADKYVYVTKLHEDVGLELWGAWKVDRVIDYLEEILLMLRYGLRHGEIEIPPDRRKALKDLLEELLGLLS